METTSKLWDLNYEVESPKKVNFLYYKDAPNYFERKREKERKERKYTYSNLRGDAPK